MRSKKEIYAVIVLLFAASFYSCIKKCPCTETINLPEEVICNAENPITDLPWLEKIINERKKIHNSSKVYIVSYKEGRGFLLEIVQGCCEPFGDCDCEGTSHNFFNCEGYALCNIEGMWGANSERLHRLSNSPYFYIRDCRDEDLEIDFETMQLIYEYNCNLR